MSLHFITLCHDDAYTHTYKVQTLPAAALLSKNPLSDLP